jgi:glycosyltransferase involved in cell wall biosynthesis
VTSEPLVTIGCAVYNGEKTLRRALAAICAQDYSQLEILIADDGSTDGSVDICHMFARQDRRIRVIVNAANVGVTRNCNNLFQEARGKYFMWADQDDVRGHTFVSRAVVALEADPAAALCHSHTGVFIGNPADVKQVVTLNDDVKQIVTLNGVAGVMSPVKRYVRFLKRYSDTTVYGLLRSNALRRTRLWRNDVGASNALLFELLLQGTFIQIPEVLYFYSGRGLTKRPSPREEYERQNAGKKMPLYYVPFIVLALNQTGGICRSSLGLVQKAALLCVLWGDVLAVGATKAIYRLLFWVSFGHVPKVITRVGDFVVSSQADVVFLHGADRDEENFPKSWFLKGGS